MGTVASALGGFVLGATVARLLDPRSGARRRAQVLQKGVHTTHEAADFTGKSLRDLRNRSRGIWHAIFGPRGPVDDAVLVERVRSKLGRVSSHPGAIEVSVSDGCVELRGPVLAVEHRQVIDAVACVRGVSRVDDDLQLHQQPDVPALQGGAARPIPRLKLLQENWAPGMRLVVGSAGAALIAWGAARRGIFGVSTGGIGALLLARSIANRPVKRVVGVGAGRRGVDVPEQGRATGRERQVIRNELS
ncbi:MAG TPA: BON domain-containing protein [Myxococcales bacterium]|nr:BON domain-containing protein [Myxococcales bacterium]